MWMNMCLVTSKFQIQEISEQVETMAIFGCRMVHSSVPFSHFCRCYEGPKGLWWMGPQHSEFGPQSQKHFWWWVGTWFLKHLCITIWLYIGWSELRWYSQLKFYNRWQTLIVHKRSQKYVQHTFSSLHHLVIEVHPWDPLGCWALEAVASTRTMFGTLEITCTWWFLIHPDMVLAKAGWELFTHDFGEAQENSLSGEGATSSKLNYQLFEMNNDIITATICCQRAGAKYIAWKEAASTVREKGDGMIPVQQSICSAVPQMVMLSTNCLHGTVKGLLIFIHGVVSWLCSNSLTCEKSAGL